MYNLLDVSFQGVRRLFALDYLVPEGAASDEAGIKMIESIFFQEEKLKITTY